MNKRKLIITTISLLIVIVAIIGGTSAYFTTAERTHNIITTSDGVYIELTETALDNSGQEIPFENIEVTMKKVVSAKKPQLFDLNMEAIKVGYEYEG